MMTSLYECQYRDLFVALVAVVEQLHLDPHLSAHARYFLRQSRIVAYTQVDLALPKSGCSLPIARAAGIELMRDEFLMQGLLGLKSTWLVALLALCDQVI